VLAHSFCEISPFAKPNFVDHSTTDQSSMIAFIEDNWGLPRITNSLDAIAGSLTNMLDFSKQNSKKRALFLDDSTGQPMKKHGHH
jgi:phospholipase C